MSRLFDISLPIDDRLPLWPGSAGWQVNHRHTEPGLMESTYFCDVHTATHIDAPAHCVKGGDTVERISLDSLNGDAFVVYLPDVYIIGSHELESSNIPYDTKRLLLRTRNSMNWINGSSDFDYQYSALNPEGAHWIVERGIDLIGIDYLSIQRYDEKDFKTHNILLESGVVILEGLNLANISSGVYELICMPLKLVGTEAAPVRAVLRSK